MKRLIALIACAIALAGALTGCVQGTSEADAQQAAHDEFAGTWALVDMAGDDVDGAKDSIELLATLGYEIHLELADDGTASLDLPEQPMDGTWEVADEASGTVVLEGADVAMSLDQGVLTLESDGFSLSFERDASDDEVASASGPSEDSGQSDQPDASAGSSDSAKTSERSDSASGQSSSDASEASSSMSAASGGFSD